MLKISRKGQNSIATVICICLALLPKTAFTQSLTLKECFEMARSGNLSLKQAKKLSLANEYNFAAEKRNYLPKVDLLSSYSYLSSPLTINLQTVRDGIVNGSSAQALGAANQVYKEITGNDLSQAAQDRIYNSSKSVIGAIYPDYNPALSRQSYFIAGVGVRQPIYLGNKLDAAKNITKSAFETSSINIEVIDNEIAFLIGAQYLRILYLNSIINKQGQIVEALSKNSGYAAELVKTEMLPPYQKSWTNVVLTQAQLQQNNFQLEKTNAIIELNKLMGADLDTEINISDTLNYIPKILAQGMDNFYEKNPLYRLVNSKIEFAKTSEKISRSFSLPNLFAIGNLNLYQKDLPVTIPKWFVGVELQWSIFNGQTWKRNKATSELTAEAKLGEKNTSENLQAQLKMSVNRVMAFHNDVTALDSARREAATTTRLVNERMKNQLSSPKDVNETILIASELEKAYYTAVLGYYLSLAQYYHIMGNPQQLTEVIR